MTQEPLSSGTRHQHRQPIAVRLFLAGMCALALVQAIRICFGLGSSLSFPGTTPTSGYETESFFAVYRGVHGAAVFRNPAYDPFCSSYFNWLFYATNTWLAKPLAAAFGDRFIPVVGRTWSLIGSLAGMLVIGWFWERLRKGLSHAHRSLGWGVAILWGCGPLLGWWAVTLRPDVWAASFEVLGLAWLATSPRHAPARSVLPSALAFFCAWSFKQTAVSGIVAASLFLILDRDLRRLLSLTLGYTFCVLVVYNLATPGYLAAFADLASNNRYVFETWRENLIGFLVKGSPLLLMLAAWYIGRPALEPSVESRGDDTAHRTLRLGMIMAIVSIPLTLMLTAKEGSSTNYYFPVSTSLALVCLALFAVRPPSAMSLAAAGLIALVLAAAMLSGRFGTVTLGEQRQTLALRWAKFSQLDEPRWSTDTRLDMPWLNPGSRTYVPAYNYDADRAAGLAFERGGIGGLFERGEFKSLLLPADTKNTFDGHSLRRYRRVATFDGMAVFILSH